MSGARPRREVVALVSGDVDRREELRHRVGPCLGRLELRRVTGLGHHDEHGTRDGVGHASTVVEEREVDLADEDGDELRLRMGVADPPGDRLEYVGLPGLRRGDDDRLRVDIARQQRRE